MTLTRPGPTSILQFEDESVKLTLRELSMVKPFQKDAWSYERELEPEELRIHEKARFYLSWRESVRFLVDGRFAEHGDLGLEAFLYDARIRWLLALCEAYPGCMGIWAKLPFGVIASPEEVRELGRGILARVYKAEYDPEQGEWAQRFFKENGHYPTEEDAARLVDEAREELRKERNAKEADVTQ